MKIILMTLSLMPLMSLATTWYVDGTNGSDDYLGTSQDKAKATIQAAIDASSDNDTILVAPGTYEPISTDNKSIVVRSIGGRETTIINGKSASRCASLGSGQGEVATILDGFTISSGYTHADPGAGVRGGTLKNCYIVGCTNSFGVFSSVGGGACDSHAYDCIFEANCATHGGALASSVAERCVFRKNYSYDDGGGTAATIARNCLFTENYAANCGGGAAGAASGHSSTNYNCTIVGNCARSGGIVADDKIYNCIIYDNVADSGEIIQPETLVVNCYMDNPHFTDAANGDYRLAADSPCIDAGDNSYVVGESDLDGSERIVNGRVDIGCYEYGSIGGPYVENVGETNWTYMIKNGKASVGDGTNTAITNVIAGAVDVPATLRGRPVTAIDNYALSRCENMTRVTIPASVKTIGKATFEGCEKLADVYIEGDTMSSIGVDAFNL